MILVQLSLVHPAAEALSRTLGALTLASRPSRDPQGGSPAPTGATRKGEKAPDSGPAPETPPAGTEKVQPGPGTTLEHLKVRSPAVFSLFQDPAACLCLCPPSDGGSASSRPGPNLPVADVHAGPQLHPRGGSGGRPAQQGLPISAEVPEPQLPHLSGAGVLQPGGWSPSPAGLPGPPPPFILSVCTSCRSSR